MPVAVAAVEWAPGTFGGPLAISERAWTMYELPGVGQHYWHDRTGYVVRAVDATQVPARVDLELDRDWEEATHAGLPDDFLASGGRDSDTGQWHFEIVRSNGQRIPGSDSLGDDLDRALADAVSAARVWFDQQVE
jgi:hypothetical protein